MLKSLWNGAKSSILFCGRGVSKTFILALASVLYALLYPSETVLQIGSGFRQSKRILLESEKIILGELGSQERVYFAQRSLKKKIGNKGSIITKASDAWSIDFATGSSIIAIPLASGGDDRGAGAGNRIRSYRATRIALDEVKDIPKSIIDKVIRPMSIVRIDPVGEGDERENQIIMSGTIDYETNHFWQAIKLHREKVAELEGGISKDYNIIFFTFEDTYYLDDNGVKHDWSPPYKMDVKAIKQDLEDGRMTEEDWLSEYKCIPIRTTGTYYPFNIINKAMNHVVAGSEDEYLIPKLTDGVTPVAIGADVARIDDYATIVVIALNQLMEEAWDPVTQIGYNEFNHMIYAYKEKSQTYKHFALKIRDVIKRFPNVKILKIDARGGDAVLDELAFNPPDGEKPIFDPLDEMRASKIPHREGHTFLSRVAATDSLNNEWNSFTRAQMERGKFYFPKPFLRHENQELEDVYRNIRECTNQFLKIRTTLSQKTNLFRFYVDNAKKNKKDLYSATIYAMGGIKEMIYEDKDVEDIPAMAAWV